MRPIVRIRPSTPQARISTGRTAVARSPVLLIMPTADADEERAWDEAATRIGLAA